MKQINETIDANGFRQLMPVAETWAYLDNAAVAALPAPTRDAIALWLTEAVEDGVPVWARWMERVEQTRRSAATLINTSPDEIALIPNTTTGISLIAEGYPWTDGDNVITLTNEFPTNQYPWLNLASRGVEQRRVPVDGVAVDLQRVIDACDERTRIIAISWIGFATGWRINVAELVSAAHERGVLVCLDAIQGLGVYPLDVQATGVDFVVADGHKWMLGPEGAGLLYIRNEHLNRLRPLGVGWNSVVGQHDFDNIDLRVRDSAARYEGGTLNMVGCLGFGASLDLLASCGLTANHSSIAERVTDVADDACRRLAEIGATIVSDRSPEHRSGIVAFNLPGQNLAALRAGCLDRKISVSFRGGNLRISPHGYANESDIDRLVVALEEQARS